MSTFRLDVPTVADAPQLARVHVQGWRDAYADLLPARFYDEAALARRTEMWEQMLSRRSAEELARAIRVARGGDGAVKGFVVLGAPEEPDPARDEAIRMLYVLPHLYGSGAGAALVSAVLGSRPAQLWVADPNPRAQRFYAKLGFTRDGRALSDPRLDGLREVRMVR